MRFTISGVGPQGHRVVTRHRAVSAIVLATNWQDLGFRNVNIEGDGSGPEPVESFRRRRLGISEVGSPSTATLWPNSDPA
jgi:hypothetical protein